MIDENKAVHTKNKELHEMLEAAQARNAELEGEKGQCSNEVGELQATVAQLQGELAAVNEKLRVEQLSVGDQNALVDTYRRENMNLDKEGRMLRESWESKVSTLKTAEQDRDRFKAELQQLSEQYKKLVDDLSFCVMDYQVKTSSTQVLNQEGKYELLSTYLNRIYDQQESTNDKYKKVGEINKSTSPYVPATVPERLVPSLLSPNANTCPVVDEPTSANAVSWADAHRVTMAGAALSPNGRLLPVTPPNTKPGWNKY